MKYSEWWLVEHGPIGALRGLPVRGRLLATNGILIMLETGASLFQGHKTNFIPDRGEEFYDEFQPTTKAQQQQELDRLAVDRWIALQPDGPARRFIIEKYYGKKKASGEGKPRSNAKRNHDTSDFV